VARDCGKGVGGEHVDGVVEGAALRFFLTGAVCDGGAPAQIGNLATTVDGRGMYFSGKRRRLELY
jgi:hypothetical protein